MTDISEKELEKKFTDLKEEYQELKEKFNLNRNSTVLVINTEGDTDPINYKKVINEKKY